MNKPNTLPEAAHGKRWSLSTWLRCYPFMRQQPELWFKDMTFTEAELAQYPEIAKMAMKLKLRV
jgi:hypothetical protein